MTPKKKNTIEMLIKLGGIDQQVYAQLRNTFVIAQAKHPKLSGEDMVKLATEYGYEHYVAKMIDLFDKHFSQEELEEIIKFWSSPIGKRLNVGSFFQDQNDMAQDWIVNLQKDINAIIGYPENKDENNASQQK